MILVFLSGGMHSGWQDIVKEHVRFNRKDVFFFDPRKHGLSDPAMYIPLDLMHVERSHIVFIYFEESNPSGIGLAMEAGYAHALGKKIIFVNESKSKYSALIKPIATITLSNLRSGTMALSGMIGSILSEEQS